MAVTTVRTDSSLSERALAVPPVPAQPIKLLVDGVWRTDVIDTPELRRRRMEERTRWFRDAISDEPGAAFPVESGRYHLYVSYACPWAHRAILYRRLKRLEDVVGMSVLHPKWGGPQGWRFGNTPMSTPDLVENRQYLYEVYQASKPDFTGRVTVPVLYDTRTRRIVNNESREIMRMLDGAFNRWGKGCQNFYPDNLATEIEALNKIILENVAEGVYRAGFAQTQERYDKAVKALFDTLDALEARLAGQPFLLGNRVTESDWHLFPVLVRFDLVYFPILRCNLKRIADYPALSEYMQRLYRLPGIAQTVKPDQILMHYDEPELPINPNIVPARPVDPAPRAQG
jgi:putative glutathione S-transferase